MTKAERKMELKSKCRCAAVCAVILFGTALFLAVLPKPEPVAGELIETETEYDLIRWKEESTEEVSVEPVDTVVVAEPEKEPETEEMPEESMAQTYISDEYVRYAYEIGGMYGICPELIVAIIELESAGNPNVVSPHGAIGLMQVVPKWHWDRMEKLGVTDLFDPYQNILVGVDFLAELLNKYHDLPVVLMCYNEGPSEELFAQIEKGYVSEYAESIMKRSSELQRMKEESHGRTVKAD